MYLLSVTAPQFLRIQSVESVVVAGRKAETGLKRLKTNFAKPNKNSPLSLHGIIWQGLGISLTKWVIRTWRFLHYALLPFLSLVDEIHST